MQFKDGDAEPRVTFHVHQLNVERTTPPEIVSSLDPNLSFMVIYCTENSVNMGITDPIFEHVLEQQVRQVHIFIKLVAHL